MYTLKDTSAYACPSTLAKACTLTIRGTDTFVHTRARSLSRSPLKG